MHESWPAMHHTDVAADQFYTLRVIHFGANLKPCSASCLPFLFEILLLTLYLYILPQSDVCGMQSLSTQSSFQVLVSTHYDD